MPVVITPCQTIDEVIAQLDLILSHCAEAHSRLGYFAALYRNVTIRVRDGIRAGRFEDGPRMDRFDVIFANRYLDALDRYWRKEKSPQCWSVAFQAAHRRQPVILQHLLLGMNAHINLDLAIAAVQTTPGDQLPGLKRDFFEITVLLSELIDETQARIEAVSPWIRIIDHVGGRTDEQICSFVIGAARDQAWNTAVRLAALPPHQLDEEIVKHGAAVAALGKDIRAPGWPLNIGLGLIRVRETRPVAVVIKALQIE